jgi:protein-L-isoaspartate O-methyltransferase
MTPRTKGFTAVMAQRREPPDALDYFPTPLWSTRALFRHVLPALDVGAVGSVWEPACGEGHMAAVMAEFAREPVIASDIFNYGYGTAPHDFLYDAPPDEA